MRNNFKHDHKTCGVDDDTIIGFISSSDREHLVYSLDKQTHKHGSVNSYEIFGWEVSLFVIIKLMYFEMKSSEVLMCQVMKASYRYNQVKKETWRKLNR